MHKLSLSLVLLAISLMGWLLFLTFRNFHAVIDHYSTREEAQVDRLFERGWLPEILPDSTFDMVIQNDLDRNTSTGSFSLKKKDLPAFLAHLRETSQPRTYQYQVWTFTLTPGGEKIFYRMQTSSP
ncbi:hypothetical protein [Roseibacillus persicicus]|uniref:YbbD head domain-containing protein n=1 Tax=Roseibacillus persicicus TaxID=454148 RepID=A0A918TWC4_9BACT|nr:hypothetical protein [Roseibacillus persicicus]GHC64651.1 hypothetical protein GCM10007100_35350 [Roseibacillus persicicus]